MFFIAMFQAVQQGLLLQPRGGVVNRQNGVFLFCCFCKAEMKTSGWYHIEIFLTRSSSSDEAFDTIIYATNKCKADLGPTATCRHITAVSNGLEEFLARRVAVFSLD